MYKNKSIIKFLLILLFTVFLVPTSLFANTIVSSGSVSVSATVISSIPIPTPILGGHGGGFFTTSVIFSGLAYPGATVYVMKNNVLKATTLSDSKGVFSITLDEEYNPNVLYTLYAIDKENRQSLLLNYPLAIKNGYVTLVSGIRFPPTVVTDKTEVKVGDYLSVSGDSLPNVSLDVVISGPQSTTFIISSNKNGNYQFTFPLTGFKKGNYNLHVNYLNDTKISKVILFTIGESNISSTELSNNIPGDCNGDNRINLIDFSIAAFWYEKPNPPRCIDVNHDNIVNLIDFSILAFYWTG
ncbi:MAG: hypothetical protein KGI58_03775 [Patescibacteria group bacterium]|nr:hypothetical protein [Patescibacteria group bacterium]